MIFSFFSRRAFLAGMGASMFSTSVFAQNPSLLSTIAFNKKLNSERPNQAHLNGYSSSILRIKKGEALNFRLQNNLPAPTSLHFYGVRGDTALDGVVGLTQVQLKQSETLDYHFTPPDSGTFWYHSLCQGTASEQLARGLCGVLIVEEPDAPRVDQDIAIIIQDWNLNEDGTIIDNFASIFNRARGGRLGNYLTVNGQKTPHTIEAAPCGRIRLRFLNATNARLCPLKFKDIQAHVIAIDGQPCDSFDPLRRTVIIAPGSRFDIIVDMPREENIHGEIGIGLTMALPLLSIISKGQKVDAAPPLIILKGNNLPPAILLQNAARAELMITGGAVFNSDDLTLEKTFPDKTRIWHINGKNGGFLGEPLLRVKRGTPIVLNITNRTAWAQVLHVHGHNFRLLHAFDDGWEPYFLDTIYVAQGRNALISFVADNVGKWAIRSTIMDHFESGVETWFEVN